MSRQFQKGLFLFRRDLRLPDNTGLSQALQVSRWVLPVFIFDPRQVQAHPYRSAAALRFMLESLQDLEGQLQQSGGKLFYFYGQAEEVVGRLIESGKADAVFVNDDYTPFSRKRDRAIKRICDRAGCAFFSFADSLLHAPGEVLKSGGGPYTVFTPFFRKAQQRPVAEPQEQALGRFFTGSLAGEDPKAWTRVAADGSAVSLWHGGRSAALKILARLKSFADYDRARDVPAEAGTTCLSPHHKFGTCSVRETYWSVLKKLGEGHGIIRSLYWRDFFTHIAYFFPQVFGHAFQAQLDRLSWKRDRKTFQRWCQGLTGFPIVDAGMRQLNETGWMHNRVRMITASFLVKDLHIDWRWGEKYFAQHLVDYDPCVNNGNWQWAASTGCDAQPYFRIFNPWRQQQRFDIDGRYIQQWVPELADCPVAMIQALEKGAAPPSGYPRIIVDHAQEKERALAMFTRLRKA